MNRLVRVELRRLAARRAVVLAVLAAVVGIAWAIFGAWLAARPLTAAELEMAEQAWQQQQEDWEENGEEYVEGCLEQQEADAELSGEDVDYGCDELEPQREWFFPAPPTFDEYVPASFAASGLLVVGLTLFMGATFTAAEFHTGSIGNWLTFEPRRGRVYASKLGALALAAFPLSLALGAVLLAGMAVAFAVNGLEAGATADTVWAVARLAALGAAAAVVGGALGVLLRHTAAVLGVVAGYALLEGMTFGVAWLQPWKVLTRIDAWIKDGTTYWVQQCTTDATGTMCEGTERVLSLGHGAWYLAAGTVLAVVTGLLVFRRRDVG